MIIKIVKHEGDYVSIANRVLEDERLSYKAKGVLAYLLTRPPHWVVRTKDLINRSTDGKTSVLSAMRELKDFGYAQMEVVRKKGRLIGRQWVIYETPKSLAGLQSFRKPVSLETCITGNQHHSKTDDLVKNKSNCGGRDSRCSPPVPSTTPGLMIFAEDGIVSPFIKNVVYRLETYVRKNFKLNKKRFNRKRWYNDIRLLLQDVEGDKGRIKRVLKTYLTQIHTKFTPQVDSAGAFRQKFTRIEKWCLEAEPENTAPTYRVSYSKATQRDIDEIPL